jgi:hypothetical protein
MQPSRMNLKEVIVEDARGNWVSIRNAKGERGRILA